MEEYRADYMEQFPQVFPDWLTPSTLKRRHLPEYIMAVYNDKIADHYQVIPGNIPPDYLNDLDAVRINIQTCIQQSEQV
jgi:hypothetical protein